MEETTRKNDRIAVSVILPLDDFSQDIHFCVDSLVYQTLEEMELLIVGNRNEADVARIMDYYAAVSPKVRMCPLPSEWAGRARQYGLSLAGGEYVLFADQNTAMMYRTCADMLAEAEEKQCDIVYAPNNEIHSPAIKIKKGRLKAGDAASTSAKLMYAHFAFPCYLYKKTFLDKNPVGPDGPFDALAYTGRVLSYSENTGYLDRYLSHTLVNEKALLHHPNDARNLAYIDAVRTLLTGCHPDAQEIVAWRILKDIVSRAQRQWRFFSDYVAFFKEIFPMVQARINSDESPTLYRFSQLPDTKYPATLVTAAFGKPVDEGFMQNAKEKAFQGDGDIVVLSESNCDVSQNALIQEAYDSGLFDFVGEYFAMKYVYENGGVYVSSLLEVRHHFECTRYLKSFFCFENEDGFCALVFGGAKGASAFKSILQTYMIRDFYADPFLPLAERVDNILIAEYDVEMNGMQRLYNDGLMVYDPLAFLIRQNEGMNLTCLKNPQKDWVSVPSYVLKSFYSSKDAANMQKTRELQAVIERLQAAIKKRDKRIEELLISYTYVKEQYTHVRDMYRSIKEQYTHLRDKYRSVKKKHDDIIKQNSMAWTKLASLRRSRIWRIRERFVKLRNMIFSKKGRDIKR